jgi:hypothetical protein
MMVTRQTTPYRPRARRLGTGALTALLLSCLAPVARAGIYYKAVTTTDVSKDRMEVEAWVEGAKARIEFRQSNNPIMGQGTYMITTDGGRTLYLVDPEEKTYSRLDLDAMLRTMGAVLNTAGPMLSMEFVDPRVELLSQEPGGDVVGLPTTHYRYRTSYQLEMKVIGIRRSNAVDSLQDIWASDALTAEGMGVWLRKDRPSGNASLDRLIQSEMAKVQGFPLRTVTVTTTTGQKGKSETSRSETVVTELDTDHSVSDDRFALPAGYRETQLPLPAEAAGTEPAEPEGGRKKGGLRRILGGGGR